MANVQRNRQIYELWSTITDIVGDADKWPKETRRLFWTRNLTNPQRFNVALFAFINGLNPEVFLQWADLKRLVHDQSGRNHFVYLFDKWEQDPRGCTQYKQWSVAQDSYRHISTMENMINLSGI